MRLSKLLREGLYRMGRRICKEVFAEKQILFLSMAFMLIVEYALNILQKSAHLYEDCIMDAFVWVSYNMQGTSYLIVMVAVIITVKDSYKPDRIVRAKSFNYIWVYNVLKSGMFSLILAVFNVAGTYLVGRIASDKLCIWDSTNSYCYFSIGKTLENVNCGLIIFTFFLSSLLGFWISALIPLFTAWYCNSYLIGAVICVFINFFGEFTYVKYDTLRDVSYSNIYQGVDLKYQFIYPFLIILLFLVIGCFKNKRDFITKISR